MPATTPAPDRRRLQSDLLRLREWLYAHEKIDAGIWMDSGPSGDGPLRVNVALAGHTPELELELRALAQHPESLDVVPVRWSLRDLRAVQDKVQAKRGSTRMRECTIPVIGVNPKVNRVEIGLHPYDKRVAAWLTRKYGADRVYVVSQSPVRQGPGRAVAESTEGEPQPSDG
jgi:hypothetical protein